MSIKVKKIINGQPLNDTWYEIEAEGGGSSAKHIYHARGGAIEGYGVDVWDNGDDTFTARGQGYVFDGEHWSGEVGEEPTEIELSFKKDAIPSELKAEHMDSELFRQIYKTYYGGHPAVLEILPYIEPTTLEFDVSVSALADAVAAYRVDSVGSTFRSVRDMKCDFSDEDFRDVIKEANTINLDLKLAGVIGNWCVKPNYTPARTFPGFGKDTIDLREMKMAMSANIFTPCRVKGDIYFPRCLHGTVDLVEDYIEYGSYLIKNEESKSSLLVGLTEDEIDKHGSVLKLNADFAETFNNDYPDVFQYLVSYGWIVEVYNKYGTLVNMYEA